MLSEQFINEIVEHLQKTPSTPERIQGYNALTFLWERYAGLVRQSNIENKAEVAKSAMTEASKYARMLIDIAEEPLVEPVTKDDIGKMD